ncbi:methyltransferase domain-containing protein [Nocardioides humi]|uniref:Methyltransferase small domain-containing protein n=1 Tax=Nocardioides humi TaxID=449461 RepID=A0ABN2AA34_9ACTN|nr:class I SAM-dependent methyltransferase [Nocardioides humi]
MTTVDDPGTESTIPFGPLAIGYDDTVLRPRPWTAVQARWAASLLRTLPAGPVLELCSGAGHIGLLAVHGSGRTLVGVDASPAACRWLQRNAQSNGVRVDVRRARLDEALRPDERFPLVVADPPWVPHDEVGRYPEDPLLAIDGGADGLDLARACVDVAAAHLMPAGALLLQLGSVEQAERLGPHGRRAGLGEEGRRVVPGRGVVVCLRPG